MLKLQSARAAKRFDDFFQIRFVFFLAFFGIWATIVSLLANNLSRCVEKSIYVYRRKRSGKLTSKSCFSYSFSTKSRQTWNSGGKLSARFFKTVAYASERKKIRKNVFGQLISLLFWKLTRKNLDFTGKSLAGMLELKSMCPEEHLQKIVFERKC